MPLEYKMMEGLIDEMPDVGDESTGKCNVWGFCSSHLQVLGVSNENECTNESSGPILCLIKPWLLSEAFAQLVWVVVAWSQLSPFKLLLHSLHFPCYCIDLIMFSSSFLPSSLSLPGQVGKTTGGRCWRCPTHTHCARHTLDPGRIHTGRVCVTLINSLGHHCSHIADITYCIV